jgi:hypothetical protein
MNASGRSGKPCTVISGYAGGGETFETIPPRREAVRATEFVLIERKLADVRVFARPLAELIAPPTVRHHAKTSSTMSANLGLSHHTLAQLKGISSGSWTEAGEREFYHDALA